MLSALFIGVVVGTLSSVFWGGFLLMRNSFGGVFFQPDTAYLAPLGFGILLALFVFSRKDIQVQNHPVTEILKTYHWGKLPHPISWFFRAVATSFYGFFNRLLGAEGAISELVIFLFSSSGKLRLLSFEDRQNMLTNVLAAAFSVFLGFPFGAAILALEIRPATDFRIKFSPFVASFSAYAVCSLIQYIFFRDTAYGDAIQSMGFFGALTGNFKPLEFETQEWFFILCAALGVGIAMGLSAVTYGVLLSKVQQAADSYFEKRPALRVLLPAVMIAILAATMPDFFMGIWKSWEDVAWLRLSNSGALLLALTLGVLFMALSVGIGSLGVFSPILTLGALLGYFFGNLFSAEWVLPLALAGSLAFFSVFFGAPFAAVAMIFELTRGSPIGGICFLSVLTAVIVGRALGYRSFQDQLFEQEGNLLVQGRLASVLSEITVSEVMSRDCALVRENEDFSRLQVAIRSSKYSYITVMSEAGKYMGLLSLERIPPKMRKAIFGEGARNVFEVREILSIQAPSVQPGDTLDHVFSHFPKHKCLPVLDEQGHFQGLIFESLAQERYTRELVKVSMRY